MKAKGEKGFTLVEVLAALTILGILFISYMTIFPQMTKMNERTGNKLETMNMAKETLVEVKTGTKDFFTWDKVDPPIVAGAETYQTEENGFQITVNCYEDETYKKACSETVTAQQERLHKIHVKVEKNGRQESETFGYFERK